MSQRSVEVLVGRLVTDEAFRTAFLADRRNAMTEFIETGYDLTEVEMAALANTNQNLWTQIAEQIDPRLQKVRLT